MNNWKHTGTMGCITVRKHYGGKYEIWKRKSNTGVSIYGVAPTIPITRFTHAFPAPLRAQLGRYQREFCLPSRAGQS